MYNASTGSLDLQGLLIRFRKKDGSGESDALVRRSLAVPAGGYVVLGLSPDEANRPTVVDYGFEGDFHGASWLPAAAVDVEACGVLVDRALYDALPTTGTYSLGTMPPTADANDFPAAWCTDTAGTPQHQNTPCP